MLTCLFLFTGCDDTPGNTPSNTNGSTTDYVSSTAPEAPECEHVYQGWIVTKEPSCTETGLESRKCQLCGHEATNVIAATHTEKIIDAVAPTCTSPGLTEGKVCSECNYVIKAQSEISALGHTEVVDAYRAPTCAAEGATEGRHCSLCKQVIVAQESIPALPHTEVVDASVLPTCTVSGLSEGKHCSVCNTVTVPPKNIEALGHTEVIDEGTPATCTAPGISQGKHCSVCNSVIVAQTTINALGHREVTDAYVAPTCASTGLTEGKHCSACKTIFVAQTTIPKSNNHSFGSWQLVTAPTYSSAGSEVRKCENCRTEEKRTITAESIASKYNSRYGYDYLGTLNNGENLQALYNEIDKHVRKFHFDTSINAGKDNVIAEIDYKKFDITSQKAVMVWQTYRFDNPLYYWFAGEYDVHGALTLYTEDRFALGSVRLEYNTFVLDAIHNYMKVAEGLTSSYEIALAYHDAILESTEYAKKADGVTPETELWAYSILGVFEKGSGVCEAYAKTFQLLLNASGIDNIFVVGWTPGGPHAWNLVQLDDGQWYWCDLTWDDTNSNPYRYFCAGDTSDFLSQHTHGTPNADTAYYNQVWLYKLPNRPKTNYKP